MIKLKYSTLYQTPKEWKLDIENGGIILNLYCYNDIITTDYKRTSEGIDHKLAAAKFLDQLEDIIHTLKVTSKELEKIYISGK